MPSIKGDGMRGLSVFISDIRNCKSKEAECKRVNKELANIRSKFKGEIVLDGYSKKKYICKLLFIFLLGHEVEFGYMEAVNLLTSNKYSEKQIGYLFVSVMLPRNSSLYKLIINNIRNDLISQNPIFENLALQCIANICTNEIAEEFAEPVGKLLIAGTTTDAIKQSAALALLKILRTYPETVQKNPSFLSRIMQLVNNNHLGLVTAATSLLDSLCKESPAPFKPLVPLAISRLHRLINANFNDYQDYLYYLIPAPWLCVALMKLLQNFPATNDAVDKDKLVDCIEGILSRNQEPPKSKKIQHTNARYAVFFEAVSLCIHLDSEPTLLVRCANQLGHFLEHRETNLRYLALESLCHLATSEYSREVVKTHRNMVVKSLQTEKDLTVRRKAVDVLYAICDKSNVKFVVGRLLDYLANCDYQLKEEMALKISILSEKYTVDYTWYIDTMLKLIRLAGEFVADEVWHRVVQIVSSHETVQNYAAKTCFEYLQVEPVHDAMVKVAAYILGEFGNYIENDQKSNSRLQLMLLQKHFLNTSQSTRNLLLSTYLKFVNLYPDLKPEIEEIFRNDINMKSPDVENQQRAAEYSVMASTCSKEVLATILDVMPPFESITDGSNEPKVTSKTNEKPILDESLTELFGKHVKNKPNKQTMPSLSHFDILQTSDSVLLRDFERFTVRDFGILYEDYQVQIGYKDEYNGSHGTLFIYVGNKTKNIMQNVQIELSPNREGESAMPEIEVRWSNFLPKSIEAGQQLMCSISLEVKGPFNRIVMAKLRFEWLSNKKQTPMADNVEFRLPIFLNKFFDAATMNEDAFIARWNHLDKHEQEFKTEVSEMGGVAIEKLLKSFGWSVMRSSTDGSLYGAALITFKQGNRVGLLYRIEQSPKPVLVLRCVKPGIGHIISNDLFKAIKYSTGTTRNNLTA